MFTKLYSAGYIRVIALLFIVQMLCSSFVAPLAEVAVNSGTPVTLETLGPLRSDQLASGQIVDLRVLYDVKVGEAVVVRAGSIAKGQVVRVSRAKGLGEPGMVQLQIRSVQAVDGQEMPLAAGNVYQEGEDRQVLSIALGVLVCILFLTMKGKNAEVPAGYQISAATATNQVVAVPN